MEISLFIEPFKSDFSNYILKFLFDILFPMILTLDEEKYYMEKYPEEYQIYFNDIINNENIENKHININFRAIICSLIKEIFKKCDIISQNNIFSLIIEIFKETINNEIYKNSTTKNKNILPKSRGFMIEILNSETKIDLCLLVIILLNKYFHKNINCRNDFFKYIILNQEKIQSINSKLINIKICKLYRDILPLICNYQQENNKEKLNCELFIEKSICFLLNNILETEAVSNISLNIIIELLDL